MTDKDKKIIRDLVVKAKGYYDGIDERLTDALKEILRRLDKPDHVPGVRKKVEPTEKPESEFTDACDRLEALKVELEQRLGIIRTQEEILKRWGEEFNGLTYRFNIVKSDNEQLAAKLDAEGFRFREQKRISKELQAKLAEANGVNEMLKEKGIG